MPLQNKLKDIRMRKYAMNKGEFAEFLGINFPTYSQIENGKRKLSVVMALKISEKLNIPVNEIWYNED